MPDGTAIIPWTGGPGCNWHVVIDWGDGSGDDFTFHGSYHSVHRYAAFGLYDFSVTGTGTPIVAGVNCIPLVTGWQYEVPTPDWEALVDSAATQYAFAKAYAPSTQGYYGQVLNIVCAAARSSNAACAPMKPYYSSTSWAGPFVYSVFNSFLADPNFVVTTGKAASISAATNELINHESGFPGMIKDLLTGTGVNAGDVASLIAGADHFVEDLNPAFNAYISTLVQNTPEAELAGALQALRTEHQALFDNAVKPGFAVQADRHDLSPGAARIAATYVPTAASLGRETSILLALNATYGPVKAADIAGYKLPTLSSLQADVRNWMPAAAAAFDRVDLHFRRVNLRSNGPVNLNVQLNPKLTVTGSAALATDQSVDVDAYWLGGVPPTKPTTFGQLDIVGAGFNLYPSAPAPDDSTVVQFTHPVTMKLTYETAHLGGVRPSELAVWDLRTVEPLPSTVDPVTRTVTAAVDHGGSFAIARSRPVAISLGNATVVEGATGTRTLRFPVSVSAPPAGEVTVHYATTPGTASAADFTSRVGTLTIPSGQLSSSINIPIKGDTLDEPNEAFTIQLANPTAATLRRSTATATIIDDDPSTGTQIAIGDASIVEGNSGRRAVWLAVTLSAAAAAPVTIHYATQPSSALITDYVTKSGTLTIPTGSTSGAISILVNADLTVEPNEYLTVVLAQPQGATIGRGTGRLNILNDD